MNKKFLILPIVVVMVIVALLAIMVKSPNQQKQRATNSLNHYLSELGLEAVKSSCNKDSDGDGYASCSYRNGATIENLECDSGFIFNTKGCKIPKHVFAQ